MLPFGEQNSNQALEFTCASGEDGEFVQEVSKLSDTMIEEEQLEECRFVLKVGFMKEQEAR